MSNQNLVMRSRERDGKKEYYVEYRDANRQNGWKTEPQLVKLLSGANAPILRTNTKDYPEIQVVDGKYVRTVKNGRKIDNLSKLPKE